MTKKTKNKKQTEQNKTKQKPRKSQRNTHKHTDTLPLAPHKNTIKHQTQKRKYDRSRAKQSFYLSFATEARRKKPI